MRRYRVVERERLVVERRSLAPEHADTRTHGFELALQVRPSQMSGLVRCGRRRRGGELLEDLAGFLIDPVERQPPLRRLGLPRLGAVVGIDVGGLVLAHRQHQLDVPFSDRIHG